MRLILDGYHGLCSLGGLGMMGWRPLVNDIAIISTSVSTGKKRTQGADDPLACSCGHNPIENRDSPEQTDIFLHYLPLSFLSACRVNSLKSMNHHKVFLK